MQKRVEKVPFWDFFSLRKFSEKNVFFIVFPKVQKDPKMVPFQPFFEFVPSLNDLRLFSQYL